MASLSEFLTVTTRHSPVFESNDGILFESTGIHTDTKRGRHIVSLDDGKTIKVPFRKENGHGDDYFTWETLQEQSKGDDKQAVKVLMQFFSNMLAGSSAKDKVPESAIKSLSIHEFNRIKASAKAADKSEKADDKGTGKDSSGNGDSKDNDSVLLNIRGNCYEVSYKKKKVEIPKLSDDELKRAMAERAKAGKNDGATFIAYSSKTVMPKLKELGVDDSTAKDLANTIVSKECERGKKYESAGNDAKGKSGAGEYKRKHSSKTGLTVIAPDGKEIKIGWAGPKKGAGTKVEDWISAYLRKLKKAGIPDDAAKKIATEEGTLVGNYMLKKKPAQAAAAQPAAGQTKPTQGNADELPGAQFFHGLEGPYVNLKDPSCKPVQTTK